MRKRLEKLEAARQKEQRVNIHIPIIRCWKDGTPQNEEEARKLAEVEKIPYSGKGVRSIHVCTPWMPGEEQTDENYERLLRDRVK